MAAVQTTGCGGFAEKAVIVASEFRYGAGHQLLRRNPAGLLADGTVLWRVHGCDSRIAVSLKPRSDGRPTECRRGEFSHD